MITSGIILLFTSAPPLERKLRGLYVLVLRIVPGVRGVGKPQLNKQESSSLQAPSLGQYLGNLLMVKHNKKYTFYTAYTQTGTRVSGNNTLLLFFKFYFKKKEENMLVATH